MQDLSRREEELYQMTDAAAIAERNARMRTNRAPEQATFPPEQMQLYGYDAEAVLRGGAIYGITNLSRPLHTDGWKREENAMYYMPSNVAAALAATSIAIVLQSPAIAQTKGAEPASRAINDSFLRALPFNDKADFDDAKRGFIATLPDALFRDAGGKPAWT